MQVGVLFWEIAVLVSGLLSVHFPLYNSPIKPQADLLGVSQATVANDLKLIRQVNKYE
jgi:hypothetical protein